MNKVFRERCDLGIVVDPDDTRAKHDSIELREANSDWRAGDRVRFITARPLADWLVSDWQHKRRHMGVPDLDFEPVRSGLFFSFRLGGVWTAADWWLSYFSVDQAVIPLRLSCLAHDVNKLLCPLLSAPHVALGDFPRENSRPSADGPAPGEYQFSAGDLERIQRVNPRWTAWQLTWQSAQDR